jgi:hypothetical protein
VDGNEAYDSAVDIKLEVTKYYLENFVTGGGNIKNPKMSFAGTVGNLEDDVVGQFQIVVHGKKGENVSYHCDNNFSSLVFSGMPIDGPQGPDASNNTATFTGIFVNAKDPYDIVTATIVIVDVAEPGKGADQIGEEGAPLFTIDGGNFQVHNLLPEVE